jgi:transcriptional regulator with XRE-family HTH domain
MDVKKEGQMLAELRKSRGLSQAELGEIIGETQDWVYNREKGITRIRTKDRVRLALALGVAENALSSIGVSESRAAYGDPLPNRGILQPAQTGKVKVYGAISAGEGNTSHFDASEVEVPIELTRPDFGALVIEGDSMMDFLHPSDVAIFRDWQTEKLNHVVAAELPDRTWVVKLMVYEDGAFKLRSLNDKYKDVTPPFRIAGFLVGFVRDDGPERLIRMNPYGLKP